MTTPVQDDVKESTRSAWVPDGLEVPTIRKGPFGKETGPTKANGQNRTPATEVLAAPDRSALDPSKWHPAGQLRKPPQDATPPERPLLERLRLYERQVQDQQNEIDQLKCQLAELEGPRTQSNIAPTNPRKRKGALDLNE